MTTDTFTRFGAVAMAISGLALGYSYIAHPSHMTPETIASGFWIAIHALFAVSLILGLLGTTALYASTADRGGGLGLAGFVTLFVGMILIFGLDYYEVLIAPYLARTYPALIAEHGAGDTMGPVAVFFPLAGLLTVLGYALLGAAWGRAGVLPRSIALALLLSAVAFGIGLSPVGGLVTARITAAAFGASLVAVAVAFWRNMPHRVAA